MQASPHFEEVQEPGIELQVQREQASEAAFQVLLQAVTVRPSVVAPMVSQEQP